MTRFDGEDDVAESPSDRERLTALMDRLRAEAARPSDPFRRGLADRIAEVMPRKRRSTTNLDSVLGAYVAPGLVLFVLAGLGVAGIGPLAI